MSASNLNPQNTSTESKSFPKPTTHGCGIWLTLDDENELYDSALERLSKENNATEQEATADCPHDMARFRPSWTEGSPSQQAGLFATSVEYGEMTDGGWEQFQALVCNTYENVNLGSDGIADNPRKVRVEIHKRTDELVYQDGNEYSTPSGWETGKNHTGTTIKIDASYVFSLEQTIAHATELVSATVGNPGRVQELMQTYIYETVRFTGLEKYHRHHKRTQDAVVQTLRDSAHLLARGGGTGEEAGDIERGMYQIYRVDTDNLEALGFDSTVEYEWAGQKHEVKVPTHSLKEYLHKNAENFSESNPLAHPKLEVRVSGGYPAPAFESVKEHLTEVLHAHIDWAGIGEEDLIADMYYDPANHGEVTTQVPRDYKRRLKEYFQSDGLKRKVIGMLFHRRTMAIHDILYTLVRGSWRTNSMSYDRLKEVTGLTKRTIGRYVSELVEHNIVSRKQSGCMFVCISDFAKSHIADLLDKMKTESQIQDEIQRRKEQREAAREQNSTNEKESQSRTPAEVALKHATDDSSIWEVPDVSSAVEDLPRRYKAGTPAEKDTAVRVT